MKTKERHAEGQAEIMLARQLKNMPRGPYAGKPSETEDEFFKRKEEELKKRIREKRGKS